MKKIFLGFATLFITLAGQAQITAVSLQASGLTCSMCSNAINKSLKSLPFIDSISANIKNSSFDIVPKKDASVNLDEIKNKVEDAGFFVAKLQATVQFSNAAVTNDVHIKSGNTTWHFLNTKQQTLNGNVKIRLLDKGFVTAKEFKKNKGLTKMPCYETGKAGSCCTKEGVQEGERIYHVTI